MLSAIYKWLAFAGALTLVITLALAKGYFMGAEHQRDADAGASAKEQQQIFTRLVADVQLGADLSDQLDEANGKASTYYGAWQTELSHEKNHLVAAPAGSIADQPLPLLSAFAVCMWNAADARAGELPGGSAAASDDAAASACASALASSGPSGFDLADAISSHGDEMDDCGFDIRELNQLLDFEAGRAANAAAHPAGGKP